MNPAPEPFRQALADLHDSAYRWALACCGYEPDRAQEVMQIVYVEILTGKATFDARSSLKTWLFAVVRNSALRHAAAARRSRSAAERFADLVSSTDDADPGARAICRRETREAVLGALQRLSPQQRQIVELVYYHDLSVAEAASVMGVGIGSARQHFHRAKQALAAALWPHKEALGDA